MAITYTLLTSGTGATLNSITPPASKPIYAFVVNNVFSGTPNTAALTGNNLTWVQVDSVIYSTTDRITVFRALGASPTNGAPTLTLTGSGTTNGIGWAFLYADGADTTGTDGSGSVVQSANNTTTGGSPDTLNATLAALADAVNNSTLAFFGSDNGTASAAFAPSSGYTELVDFRDSGTQTLAVQVTYAVPGTTTPGTTFAVDFSDLAVIALEIKAAGGATGKLFRTANLSGLQGGGPLMINPIG